MFINDISNKRHAYDLDFFTVRRTLNEFIAKENNTDSNEKELIRKHLMAILKNDETYDYERLANEFYEELFQYSVLTPFMVMGNEHKITDLFVELYNDISYMDNSGKITNADVSFYNDEHLKMFLDKFVDLSNSELNKSKAILETTLPNGARLTAQHPKVNTNGNAIAIRFKNKKIFSGADYVKFGSATDEMITFYKYLTNIGARILIHGITGSGKTSLLESIICMYPRGNDGRSIHRHGFVTDTEVLHLKERDPYLRINETVSVDNGTASISLSDAVKANLRMKIDKFHFNEIRGEEIHDVFVAWHTGHDGVSGVFGKSIENAWNGVITKIQSANTSYSSNYCSKLTFDSVDVFIECRQIANSKKVQSAVRLLHSLDKEGNPEFITLFEYDFEKKVFISHFDNEKDKKLRTKIGVDDFMEFEEFRLKGDK